MLTTSAAAPLFAKVLIANRGEIALRLLRTVQELGITAVVIYSHADRHSPAVRLADEAYCLSDGEHSAVADTYLNADKILTMAQACGAEAILPGYGLLAENADFARRCAQLGITFVGPTEQQLRQFGLKHEARTLAKAAGVALLPGTDLLMSLEEALSAAATLGYPLMLKSTAGGGGIGLCRCNSSEELAAAFARVQQQGQAYFQHAGVFLERCVEGARHLEVQIVGDGLGQVVALGERDCSLQRRHQKVVEETPAPGLSAATRERLCQAAIHLGQWVQYRSVGTVEFIYEPATEAFYFLEVNSRLQVEHTLTEAVTGLDLVALMLQIAAGQCPDLTALPQPSGVALEVRLYAEDPLRDFAPMAGTLSQVWFPERPWLRVDGWVEAGSQISSHYDPLLAKLIVQGADRPEALRRLSQALDESQLEGLITNQPYLRALLDWAPMVAGQYHTTSLAQFSYQPPVIAVVQPGTFTSVQDYPGRVGYWAIGVPPSGPMDDRSFRLANALVGNAPDAAGLECTLQGPVLRFYQDSVIAICGGLCQPTLDGQPIAVHGPVLVTAGQTLDLGTVTAGCRSYLAVRGGLATPEYLGSRATFALGQLGGVQGRCLQAGDQLPLGQAVAGPVPTAPLAAQLQPGFGCLPQAGACWQIGVLHGPHGAPDFFTPEYLATFFASDWQVHYQSNRLGVRLSGPKPQWSRQDGGEAGLHPSNIHDCQYAIGSINFTGDSPVILGPDGPSLGGFVCPVTVARAEQWKLGQLRPGDRIRFVAISFEQALMAEQAWDQALSTLSAPVLPQAVLTPTLTTVAGESACVLARLPADDGRPQVSYRQAGDKCLLVEYGDETFSLALRLRVHALMQALAERPIAGVEELSPGVRCLQIRFDSRRLSQSSLLKVLMAVETTLPDVQTLKVPSRTLWLPLAFEDSSTLAAVDRYRQSVRDTAPWLPNNVDFIQRINGLSHRDQVAQTLYAARYLVLGLGDVYLGAPCAVPLDPRHRLLTSKYNPARTHTAEGAVGIGGVYLCIYGMDSPGGYQLVGRTLPIWQRHAGSEPCVLRFFDQIRFYPVAETELPVLREAQQQGRLALRIEEGEFCLAEHETWLAAEADEVRAFEARQQAAFAREIALWQQSHWQPQWHDTAPPAEPPVAGAGESQHPVAAQVSGSIWKLLVSPGQRVSAGEPLVILEAMKMEFAIAAPVDGVVGALLCQPGRQVQAGEPLLHLAPWAEPVE